MLLFYTFFDETFEDGREGTPFDYSNKERFVRTYTRTFKVGTNTSKADALFVCSHPNLPRPFASYFGPDTVDLYALMVKMSAKQIPNTDGLYWTVTCEYSTDYRSSSYQAPGSPGSPKGGKNDPEEEPPDLEWDFEEAPYYSYTDMAGVPFLNSAFQPFLNPPALIGHRPILILSRNELNYDPKRASMFAGGVNDKTFLEYPSGSVLCMAPKVKLVYNQGVMPYWRVTYRIKFGMQMVNASQENGVEYEYESFQLKELDQGFSERFLVGNPAPVAAVGGAAVAGAANIVQQQWVNRPIIPDGMQSPKPTMLDGNGRKQIKMVCDRDGNILYPLPVYLKFQTRRKIDMESLFKKGLGGTFPPKRPQQPG